MTLPGPSGPKSYLVIAGHGRSGSNRLLDAFDCHPEAFCRNEPNRPEGSPFYDLAPGFFERSDPEFPAQWARVIDRASRQMSGRDRLPTEGKSFVASPLRKAFAKGVFLRGRVRRALAPLLPAMKSETAPAEGYYAEPGALSAAFPVFKILLAPGWIVDAFHGDPRMRVILNLRAPRPFLRSWRNRYAAAAGPEQTFADNLVALPEILDFFGASERMPDRFSEGALLESELWRWRYVNEVMLTRLSGEERFTLSTYEDFDADPLAETARLYAFADLEMTPDVRDKIAALENTLFRALPGRPDAHDPLIEDVIETVTADSPLRKLWPEPLFQK